jgi:hypothetical protein
VLSSNPHNSVTGIALPYQKLFFALYVVNSVPCHHGMACPTVADGEDGLQIWRVVANILKNQVWTAETWWSSILGVMRMPNNSSTLKIILLEQFQRS